MKSTVQVGTRHNNINMLYISAFVLAMQSAYAHTTIAKFE